MKHKATFLVWIKEILSYIPIINYFFSCEPSQTIVISVAENFSNADFHISSFDFTLKNTHLHFSAAYLKIRSSLFGVRYLMRQWFYATALIVISILTVSTFLSFISFYLIIKSGIKGILLRLYPEATSSGAVKKALHLRKKDIDLSSGKGSFSSDVTDDDGDADLEDEDTEDEEEKVR